MNIQVETHGNAIHVEIKGNITSIDNTETIKDTVNDVIAENRDGLIKIIFCDSGTVPSALLGFLLKIKRLDKREMEIIAQNTELYSIFENLNLVQLLNVKKS